jgi:ABC-type nitrate/sulfonate/bicarbonate transport system ATPase subunit
VTVVAVERAVLVRCRGVGVAFGRGEARVAALRGVDLAIAGEDSLAVWGRSGSGKTTLLHVLAGLVQPTEGSVERDRHRLSVGYVFQGANLLPHFTAYENVAFARRAAGLEPGDGGEPEELLELVGLGGKLDSLPAELSGGRPGASASRAPLRSDPACCSATSPRDSSTPTPASACWT